MNTYGKLATFIFRLTAFFSFCYGLMTLVHSLWIMSSIPHLNVSNSVLLSVGLPYMALGFVLFLFSKLLGRLLSYDLE